MIGWWFDIQLQLGVSNPYHNSHVFKNKGDCKNAKNYRGITVTPTLSKIIEKILKIRENGKILLNQNPLQRGFTENSSPLLCELLVEEFERENKDLKRPTYIAIFMNTGNKIPIFRISGMWCSWKVLLSTSCIYATRLSPP
jgi:hypothetical protein